MVPSWSPPKVTSRRLSLSENVYAVLREAILNLELPPGSRLVESELSSGMGTSATPVREALQRLQNEGLVESPYARTAVVRGLPVQDIRELYQVRALLETWAVKVSVPRFDEEGKAELERIVREAEDVVAEGDLVAFSRLNNAFHAELCRRCGNQFLLRQLAGIADQLHRVRIALAKQTYQVAAEASDDAVREHWDIIKAVRAGDAEQTASLVLTDITALLKDIDAGRLDSLQLILDPEITDKAHD